MEKFNISYSTKNIPLPSRSDYLQRLLEKTEQFLRRIRWKAYFSLNPDTTSSSKETYGFKSTKNPPPIEELKDFENDMLKMIQSVKFKQVNNSFLDKLKEDTDRIKNEPKLLIAADKTTNFYKLEPSTYNDLLEKNITKSYKKAQPEATQAIHKENKAIATKLRIDDRVDTTADKDAFITLKDHKPNFANKPTCRLINPTKSEIGKISKNILDRINRTIAKKHNLNQWKNTTAVINWFKSIENKQQFNFICFDIEEFYPSISQDLLNKALDFASNYDNITTEERSIIIHAKNSILIHKHIPWQKKGNATFHVTMGSYDGAETCELVGSFLLSQLQDLNINVGLYRDDGLAITNATPRDTENIKKEVCRIFNSNGLRITIEANKQIINFLDVTFNLNRSTYQPFTKPNTSLQYVHRESNHPPITTKNIPAGINKRLSSLSSDKASFDQAAPPYQKALDESGYHYTLQYEPAKASKRKNLKFNPAPQRPPNQDRRRRNIIWFNPPFNRNVLTHVGRAFINLVDKCFATGHKLRKIFNRNTVKLSYSCTPSMKQLIDGHNKTILKKDNQPVQDKNVKTCNCRNRNDCPLQGECLQKEIVYQATVTTREEKETYVGLTATAFKTRWRNHQMSFKHEKKRYDTELSKYLWELKMKNEEFKVSWKILAKARAYSNLSKRCNLCIEEKYFIIMHPQMTTLNKRNELVSTMTLS